MKQSPPSPKFVRWFKYGCSFLFLPTFIKNWSMPILGHLGLINLDQGRILNLTNGAKFKIKHLLDVLTILEVNINNDYYFPKVSTNKPVTVIDIGGNIGAFAVFAASQGDQIKIHSFEPSRSTFTLLKQNINLNGLGNQIIPHNQAVFKKSTKLKLFSSGPSGLKSIYQTRNEKKFELVSAVTLENVFKKNKIKKCNFLKLDCEGAEYDILSSIPDNIFNKISQISLEFHEITPKQNHHQLIEILEAKGFLVEHRYHGTEHDIGYIYAVKPSNPWLSDMKETATPIKHFLSNLSIRVRSDQFSIFKKVIKPTSKDKILDVGVTSDETLKDSNMFEKLYPYSKNLTAATIENTSDFKKLYPKIKVVKVKPNQSLPFKTNQFDTVVSWATLEHIGGYQKQQKFINELIRVGKKVFITTPYRGCPYEPHTGLWFIHWFPLSYFRWFCVKTNRLLWATELNLNPLWIRDIKKIITNKKIKVKIYKLFGIIPSHLLIYSN